VAGLKVGGGYCLIGVITAVEKPGHGVMARATVTIATKNNRYKNTRGGIVCFFDAI